MTTPQTATKQTNEAALCRSLTHEPYDDWQLVTVECGLRDQTLLYNAKRHIGIQITGLLHRGRIWMHDCPVHWRSKAALREADAFIQRHAHLDLHGLPEVG